MLPSCACSGDFTRGDGTGGESIYGAKFPDEVGAALRLRSVADGGVLHLRRALRNTLSASLVRSGALWRCASKLNGLRGAAVLPESRFEPLKPSARRAARPARPARASLS